MVGEEGDGGVEPTPALKREVGLWGAVTLGLGSILGTGVFVSIGIAAGVIGPGVIVAVAVAALVATCNGLSSAQLAANHPESGGTYEYGHRWLKPWIGFSAGWMFLCAKGASAATAALGIVAYARRIGMAADAVPDEFLAVSIVAAVTLLVLVGLRRSNQVNTVLVISTVGTLVVFVMAGARDAWMRVPETLDLFWHLLETRSGYSALAEACSLMFVAYTGYGRIATMGEEIANPSVQIPKAMVTTLGISMTLYVAVAAVGVGAAGADAFSVAGDGTPAPLEKAALVFGGEVVSKLVAVGAVLAMLGVLLNLVLGLSRVALAMGRRRDLPPALARLDARGESPRFAVAVVGGLIAGLVLLGDVRTTWSFSAFTVLVYYALTNLAALRLTAEERLYPQWISAVGLSSCGFLAFWVSPQVWVSGLAVLALGLVIRPAMHAVFPERETGE